MANRVKRDTSGYGRSGGKRAFQQYKYREDSGRRGTALAKTRAHQQQIDAAWEESKRIIAEAEAEVRAKREVFTRDRSRGTLTATWVAESVLKRTKEAERQAAINREKWTLGQARSLVRQGYTVAHVVARTGWSSSWIEDADKIFD